MTHRAGLDQQSVIQAAADLADSSSLEDVTLATLAAKLGIRAPTLYHYVSGLDGLRRELALLGARQMARALGQAIMGFSGGEAVEVMAIAYRDFAHEHPGLYNAFQRAANPEDTALQEAQTEVLEIVLRVVAPSRSDRDSAIHTVRLIRSLMHGFVSLEIGGGFGFPQDIDETFQRLVQVMVQVVKEGKTK
ncbi:MAG: WHG domain-containing protein [Ktedonobacteraceae bacterium]|nr:WHG domain-containing protein [Ktedonobacteraceae bacterium]